MLIGGTIGRRPRGAAVGGRRAGDGAPPRHLQHQLAVPLLRPPALCRPSDHSRNLLVARAVLDGRGMAQQPPRLPDLGLPRHGPPRARPLGTRHRRAWSAWDWPGTCSASARAGRRQRRSEDRRRRCSPDQTVGSGPSSLHRRDIECDLHLVAEERSARLERLIPAEAEISAVELSTQLELDPFISARLACRPAQLRVERDLTGDAAHRQVADELQTPAVEVVDLGRVEADLRIALDVEEVGGATQVLVSHRRVRVDRGRVDHPVARGRPAPFPAPIELAEAAGYRREHHVLHGESNVRARRVDRPCA